MQQYFILLPNLILKHSILLQLLVIIALILNGANLYGYIKCKAGQSASLGAVTTDFLRKQVLQGAVSIVSRQAATPTSNTMSAPTNIV